MEPRAGGNLLTEVYQTFCVASLKIDQVLYRVGFGHKPITCLSSFIKLSILANVTAPGSRF